MNTKSVTKIAMIAAVYTVVSLVLAPISYGPIQVRLSEALTMLPLIYKQGIHGITLGCFLANLIGALIGANPTGLIDSIIGTSATLLAGICTYKFKDVLTFKVPLISIAAPVVFNGIIVGLELAYFYYPDNFLVGFGVCAIEVAIGEVIAVILGYLLIKVLNKTNLFK